MVVYLILLGDGELVCCAGTGGLDVSRPGRMWACSVPWVRGVMLVCHYIMMLSLSDRSRSQNKYVLCNGEPLYT